MGMLRGFMGPDQSSTSDISHKTIKYEFDNMCCVLIDTVGR